MPTPYDYPVTLTVTDNSTPPLVDTDTIIDRISEWGGGEGLLAIPGASYGPPAFSMP